MIVKHLGRVLCILLSAAILCFCGCSDSESASYYFVEFSISSNFYADGEKLDGKEIRTISDEVGKMLNSIEDDVSTEKDGSVAQINAAGVGEKFIRANTQRSCLRFLKNCTEKRTGLFRPRCII